MNNTATQNPKTNSGHAETNDKSGLAVDVCTSIKMTNSNTLRSLPTDLNKGEASPREISSFNNSHLDQISEKVLKISQEIAKKITNSRIKSKPKTTFQPYVFKKNPLPRNVVTIRVAPPPSSKLGGADRRNEYTPVKEKQFGEHINFIHAGKTRLVPFNQMLGTGSSSSTCLTSQQSEFSLIKTCSVNGKSYVPVIKNANNSLTFDSRKTHGVNSELQTNTTEFNFTIKVGASCKSQTTAVQTTYDLIASELKVSKIKKNRRSVNKSRKVVTKRSKQLLQHRKPRRKNISRYHRNKLKKPRGNTKFQNKAVDGMLENSYIRYKEMNIPLMPKPANLISELYVNKSTCINQECSFANSVIESNQASTSTKSTEGICISNATFEGSTCANQQMQFEEPIVDQVKLIAGLLEPFIPAYKRRRPYPVAMWKAIQPSGGPI